MTPPEPAVRSTCPYCGVGCGLLAEVQSGRLVRVAGDPDHPVNAGRTCRKPVELPSAVHSRARALVPKRRALRHGPAERIGWDEATEEIAGRLLAIRERHGAQAIGFYVSGQLLTEDYYAVNKLAKGVLGTNSVDSNSRLCMSSAVAGYRATFGADGPPPGYDDLDEADLLLLLGSNAAACHPIVWERIQRRADAGAELVVVDPRRTPTAAAAALHLPVRPGGDLALLLAMLHVVERDGLVDERFVAAATEGAEELLAQARRWSPQRAARVCDVPAAQIEEAAHRFGGASRAMALWSMGANQSTHGTRINRALHALCLLTGNIGRPGTGPLSLTGQPNAMGGREVGGLADLLPGYRNALDARDRAEVEAHWRLPAVAAGISDRPGLPAGRMFEALETGELKAIWIVATNPVVSFPDVRRVKRALEAAELVIVQDAYEPTETTRFADYLLPAAQWPEKEGTTTNSERRVSRVRRALDPPGEALPDWEIFAALGAALGAGEAFAWPDAAAVHAEFVALTAGRPCDQSGLSHARLDRDGPLQWPVPAMPDGAAPHPGTPRLYADGRFPTPTGRARLEPLAVDGPAEPADDAFPLRLTTGRLAGHWHTLSRTGRSPALRSADPEPRLDVHPDDLAGLGRDGELVRVRSRRGWVVLRARADATLPRGTAFAPFHWGELFAGAGHGGVNAVTTGATDPTSHQPELKACAVRLERADRAAEHSAVHPTRLVIAGGGPAAVAVLEAAFALRPPHDWSVTVLCGEDAPPYDRVALSRALAPGGPRELGLKDPAWYRERGVHLALGRRAERVDAAAKIVHLEGGSTLPYDQFVIATGSRVAAPPIAGLEQDGVVLLRTAADAERVRAVAERGGRIAVIGGGLVGVEAAAALAEHGGRVHLVHAAPRLIERQLDAGSARWLLRALQQRGIAVELGVRCDAITGSGGAADGVRLHEPDGLLPRRIDADLVVVATGIAPVVAVAERSGLRTARGIVVDDALRTSAPGVWALGECAEHDGVVYGTWPPIEAQARALAADLAGVPGGFRGRPQPAKLKVPGVRVFSCGEAAGSELADPDVEEVVAIDTRAQTYRRIVFRGRDLLGAVLMGDLSLAGELTRLMEDGGPLPDALLDGLLAGESGDPEAELVCSCKGVTAGQIGAAVREGAADVAAVRDCTGASGGCGSCAGRVAELITMRASAVAVPG